MDCIINFKRFAVNLFKNTFPTSTTNRTEPKMASQVYTRRNSHTHEIMIPKTSFLSDYHEIDIGKSIFTIKKRYQNLSYIGKGSQGCVVEAFDTVSQQKVAIKKIVCPLEMAKFAFRELFLLKHLKHQNVINLLDAFTPFSSCEGMNEYYVVMNKMDATMADLSKPLDHVRMAALIYQILCALHYLHAKGIIHRDLKPLNIGVMQTCELKLLDFGLARSIPRMGRRMSMHMVTLHYRAPELLLGIDYDATVDMWSVGCILAELISDRVLFRGCDEVDQLHKIVSVLGFPDTSLISQSPRSAQDFFKNYKDFSQNSSIQDIFPDSAFKAESGNTIMNGHARDLLGKLLECDPRKRISAAEALHHPYFDEFFTPEDLVVSPTEIPQQGAQDFDTFEAWKSSLFSELKSH